MAEEESEHKVNFQASGPEIYGPSVFVIGYIPHSSAIPKATAYHEFNLMQRIGLSLLFRTGNPEPTNAICTRSLDSPHIPCQAQAVREFFKKNPPQKPEFRTVCWLRGVSLKAEPDGRAKLSFFRGHRVGKTPSPVPPNSRWRRLYFKGDGEDTYESPVWNSDGVRFVYRHTFKLGKLSDSAAALFMGCFAPSALIQIEYTLRCDGSYRVSLSGSTLPSQRSYVLCDLDKHWDMLRVDRVGINSFVYAGRCKTAPPRLALH